MHISWVVFIVIVVYITTVVGFSDAFLIIPSLILKSSSSSSSSSKSSTASRMMIIRRHQQQQSSYTSPFHPRSKVVSLSSKNDNDDNESNGRLFEEIDISEEFDEQFLEELERDKPSDWMVMKEVRK